MNHRMGLPLLPQGGEDVLTEENTSKLDEWLSTVLHGNNWLSTGHAVDGLSDCSTVSQKPAETHKHDGRRL